MLKAVAPDAAFLCPLRPGFRTTFSSAACGSPFVPTGTKVSAKQALFPSIQQPSLLINADLARVASLSSDLDTICQLRGDLLFMNVVNAFVCRGDRD